MASTLRLAHLTYSLSSSALAAWRIRILKRPKGNSKIYMRSVADCNAVAMDPNRPCCNRSCHHRLQP